MTTITNVINNLSLSNIDYLHQKYNAFLNEFRNENNVVERLYVIDVSVNYLKTNYNTESKNLKSWAVIVVLRLYESNKTTETDIHTIINNFIRSYKNEIAGYVNDIVVYASDYDREIDFINQYANKIKGS